MTTFGSNFLDSNHNKYMKNNGTRHFMYFTIYKTTNLINGKYYIGMHKTDDLDDGYLGSGYLLRRAIKKHGKEKFQKEILFVFDNKEDMISKEVELITEEDRKSKLCYNIAQGGSGGNRFYNRDPDFVKNHSSEMGKISTANRWNNPELRQKFTDKLIKNSKKYYDDLRAAGKPIPSNFEGKFHSGDTKEKMRQAKKGMFDGDKNPSYGTMWITDGITNKKVTKDSSIPDGWRKGRVCKST